MNTQSIIWIAMAAYSVHMMEEFFYDWKNWANNILRLPVEWSGFYITNTIVLFLGIACAETGWTYAWFALSFPALMIINGFFFHVLPFVITKKFSPGLFTAVILFFPIGIYAFTTASASGISGHDIILSFLIGIFLMAVPIVLLKTQRLPFFKQTV